MVNPTNMNLEGVDQLSAIRVGDRIIYNGVNGDAFSFGAKASISQKDSNSNHKPLFSVANNAPPPPPDQPAISSTQVQLKHVTEAPPSPSITVKYSSQTSLNEAGACNDVTPFKVPLTKAVSLDSYPDTAKVTLKSETMTSQDHPPPTKSIPPSTKTLQPLSISPQPHVTPPPSPFQPPPSPFQPPPTALGLPPILPPPPAAHLPPPLPSRPPSATPSRSSSMSSLRSSWLGDRSCPPSPTESPPPFTDRHVGSHLDIYSAYSYLPKFLFRSSGTIKVEESPKITAPTSPPPLPSPPIFSQRSSRTSVTSTNSAQDISTSSRGAGRLNCSTHSYTPPYMLTPLPSTDEEDSEIEEEDIEVVENRDIPSADECEQNVKAANEKKPKSHQGSDIVPANEKGSWFFNKKSKDSQNRTAIPPEFGTIRRSTSMAEIITRTLVVYKFKKTGKAKKKSKSLYKLEKAPTCRKCKRPFDLWLFRHYCKRCKRAFCDKCLSVARYDAVEQEGKAACVTRVCDLCCDELAHESARGCHRGLWSEFEKMRKKARENKGLEVTTSRSSSNPESETLQDMIPGLRSLCMRFLVELHRQLQKQPRHKFLASYLHFENRTVHKAPKAKRMKFCTQCKRPLHMLTEIRDCSLCENTFCMICTYKTLQLYLTAGTDLTKDVTVDMIRFNVKIDENEEEENIEASETYRVCEDCENSALHKIKIHEYNTKIPELETEMFDLQRQIDDALTSGPAFFGMYRSSSAQSIGNLRDNDPFSINIKLASKLYDRYLRGYDSLVHMAPQTPGQRALHKHIQQAMYDFYLQRRDQLRTILRKRESCESLAIDNFID